MYRREIYILILAVILLLIGACIYLFFRLPTIALTSFCLSLGVPIYYNSHVDNSAEYIFLYCLPDALWYMSLLLVQTLFLEEKGWLNRLLIGFAVSLPFLLEIGQYLGLFIGTFDWFDIITYFLTLILFLCLRKTSLLSLYKQSQ